MNRFLTLSITAVLSVASIAGVATAASHEHDRGPGAQRSFGINGHDADMPLPSSSPEVGSSPAPYPMGYAQASASQQDRLIRQWKGGRVDVVPLGNLGDTSMRASLEHRRANEPARVAAVETSIERNHRLANRLEARNIPIDSVVDARTAGDGNITLYIR